MPALQVNRHRNITEIFKRVSGQKSKDGKKHLDSVTLSMAKAELQHNHQDSDHLAPKKTHNTDFYKKRSLCFCISAQFKGGEKSTFFSNYQRYSLQCLWKQREDYRGGKVQQTKKPTKLKTPKHMKNKWKSTLIPEKQQDNSISLMHL